MGSGLPKIFFIYVKILQLTNGTIFIEEKKLQFISYIFPFRKLYCLKKLTMHCNPVCQACKTFVHSPLPLHSIHSHQKISYFRWNLFFLFHLLFYQILILFLPKCSNVCVSLDRIKQFGSNGLNPKTTNTKKKNSKHCTFLRFNVLHISLCHCVPVLYTA